MFVVSECIVCVCVCDVTSIAAVYHLLSLHFIPLNFICSCKNTPTYTPTYTITSVYVAIYTVQTSHT